MASDAHSSGFSLPLLGTFSPDNSGLGLTVGTMPVCSIVCVEKFTKKRMKKDKILPQTGRSQAKRDGEWNEERVKGKRETIERLTRGFPIVISYIYIYIVYICMWIYTCTQRHPMFLHSFLVKIRKIVIPRYIILIYLKKNNDGALKEKKRKNQRIGCVLCPSVIRDFQIFHLSVRINVHSVSTIQRLAKMIWGIITRVLHKINTPVRECNCYEGRQLCNVNWNYTGDNIFSVITFNKSSHTQFSLGHSFYL